MNVHNNIGKLKRLKEWLPRKPESKAVDFPRENGTERECRIRW